MKKGEKEKYNKKTVQKRFLTGISFMKKKGKEGKIWFLCEP